MSTKPPFPTVQVILTAVDPDADDGFFDRRILLTNIDPEITIGRSTKRDLQLTAKSHNACFDCPVMSRKHAKLQFWPFNHSVSIYDIGSLHGTHVNNRRIAPYESHRLTSGDVLKFGDAVQKGHDTFPACEMRIVLRHTTIDPYARPLVFTVPDSSDEEDIISDVDEVVDSDEETSVGKTRWAGIPSLLPDRTAIRSTVDLTSAEASASKAQGAPSDAFCSGDISSNGKPASETKPSRCVPESGNSHGNAGVAHTSLRLDTDEEGLCDGNEGSAEAGRRRLQDLLNGPAGSGLCWSALTCLGPSNRANFGTDSGYLDNSHKEGHVEGCAVAEDAGSSKICSTPKLSPQTQLVDREKGTPSPGGATLDAMALSTICQPTVIAKEKHQEASAGPKFSIDFGATKTNFLAGTKADFFAAREHNRHAHASLTEAAELLRSSNGITKDDESSLPESSRCPISDVLGPSKSWTCTTTAALLASGAALAPNAEVAPADCCCVEDSFEYSSAFACEMSKMTDIAAILEDGDTLLTDGIETDPPQPLATEAECRPKKRKSDQLSVGLLTEAETGSSQIRDKSSALAPAAGAGRPLKRLRRAAEALGYATLGGFAVVSVLIATAPEF
ncbi:hypothetical protein E4U09_003849 [Claviceps aff. purpurea]|uniref:FHA domain-containing protein n=1 Tax=Claviceps aff. purpurea TaxID=1967640 RepID=A0A9P7U053_9HYPO|nr:hypothetical protein E4U09_003849 [Claviceps aff. purpurea]